MRKSFPSHHSHPKLRTERTSDLYHQTKQDTQTHIQEKKKKKMYGPSDAVFKQRKDPPGGPKTGPIGEPHKNAWPALMVPLIGLRITESPFKATGKFCGSRHCLKRMRWLKKRKEDREGEREKFCWSARAHGRDVSFARGLRAEIRSFGTAIMLVLCLCLGFADFDFLELLL